LEFCAFSLLFSGGEVHCCDRIGLLQRVVTLINQAQLQVRGMIAWASVLKLV
jgi:hypothetical protein